MLMQTSTHRSSLRQVGGERVPGVVYILAVTRCKLLSSRSFHLVRVKKSAAGCGAGSYRKNEGPTVCGQPFGLVRRRGLEPLCLAALAPQASASANFATSALNPAYECGEAVSNPKISIPSVGGIARLRVALGCSVRYGNRPRIKCRNTERDSRGSLAWIRTCAASFLRLRNCECWDVLTQVFWDEGR